MTFPITSCRTSLISKSTLHKFQKTFCLNLRLVYFFMFVIMCASLAGTLQLINFCGNPDLNKNGTLLSDLLLCLEIKDGCKPKHKCPCCDIQGVEDVRDFIKNSPLYMWTNINHMHLIKNHFWIAFGWCLLIIFKVFVQVKTVFCMKYLVKSFEKINFEPLSFCQVCWDGNVMV